jgi:hypothetical protein
MLVNNTSEFFVHCCPFLVVVGVFVLERPRRQKIGGETWLDIVTHISCELEEITHIEIAGLVAFV